MTYLFRAITLLFFAGAMNISISSTAFAEVSVVTHQQVSIKQLNRNQLRRIFSMRQPVWPDGQPIVVYVFSSSNAVNQSFCKQILQMFPYQLERQWNRLTYSGVGEPPVVVSSVEEMKRMIADTPGSIGYLPDSVLTPEDNLNVLTGGTK